MEMRNIPINVNEDLHEVEDQTKPIQHARQSGERDDEPTEKQQQIYRRERGVQTTKDPKKKKSIRRIKRKLQKKARRQNRGT